MSIQSVINSPLGHEYAGTFNDKAVLFAQKKHKLDDQESTKIPQNVPTPLPALEKQLKVLSRAELILSGRFKISYSALRAIAVGHRLL